MDIPIFPTTYFILKRIERDKIKMYIGLLVKRMSYSCPISMKLEFSRQIFENSEI
jgi:hypothetical protein